MNDTPKAQLRLKAPHLDFWVEFGSAVDAEMAARELVDRMVDEARLSRLADHIEAFAAMMGWGIDEAWDAWDDDRLELISREPLGEAGYVTGFEEGTLDGILGRE